MLTQHKISPHVTDKYIILDVSEKTLFLRIKQDKLWRKSWRLTVNDTVLWLQNFWGFILYHGHGQVVVLVGCCPLPQCHPNYTVARKIPKSSRFTSREQELASKIVWLHSMWFFTTRFRQINRFMRKNCEPSMIWRKKFNMLLEISPGNYDSFSRPRYGVSTGHFDNIMFYI